MFLEVGIGVGQKFLEEDAKSEDDGSVFLRIQESLVKQLLCQLHQIVLGMKACGKVSEQVEIPQVRAVFFVVLFPCNQTSGGVGKEEHGVQV